jgi:glutathione S-transferase
MPELILHHYPMSPFAQKIRSMLGYAQTPWLSAITREIPPRPVLAALAGGYRKIPVAQIGADIFCDTRIIAAEIAALSHKPELALENCSQAIQDYVHTVDLEVFFACVLAGGSKKLNKKVLKSMSLLDIGRLLFDRINMGRKASVKIVSPRQARPRVIEHLIDLEARIVDDFIFGATPCHADFSVYHGLWFIRDLGERRMINDFPKTIAWMDRMKAFGDGSFQPIAPQQTLIIARESTARPIAPEHQQDPRIGKAVSIAPADYGQAPTQGKLAGATPTRWIITRQDKKAGELNVHFPKQGYVLSLR